MNNPWKEISLSDYENHMSLDSVKQAQALNELMKEQFQKYDVISAMVLGVAGGNGLEHVEKSKYTKVFGVDINSDYLQEVESRFQYLNGILECICVDLVNENDKLPQADLLMANLLVEYIGYDNFKKVVKQVSPNFVSTVIQINEGEEYVSESPYLHVFDRLDEVHHQMSENEMTKAMDEAGYHLLDSRDYPLPNGKKLVKLDYSF